MGAAPVRPAAAPAAAGPEAGLEPAMTWVVNPDRSTALLPFGPEVAVVVAQVVEAAEGQVEHGPVERPLLAPELVEQALEVVGQAG